MAVLEKTMFRDYDIRGKVNEKELNEKSIFLIAKGFAKMLSKKGIDKCILGFDARSYSEGLGNSLAKGLLESGIDVIEIGMVSTPVAYFAQYHFNVKGLAMITASHNPNGWSGVKLGYDFSSTLLPKDINELYKIIQEEKFVNGSGKKTKEDGITPYIENLKKIAKIKRKFRIVVNARHGIAGPIYPKVLRSLGMDVVEQYCNIDFSYPHGDSNPSVNSMIEELGRVVARERADIGLAFDADGDRLGVTDEKGQLIYPDKVLLLLARKVLKEKPKAPVVFDVKCSQALEEDIKAHGGKPVMWKTGHSFIKEKMHDIKAPLAGERSGHIFYSQGYYGFDDACFAAIKLLEFLSEEKNTLSEIVQSAPQYSQSPVWHAPCADEVKKDVCARLVKHLKKKFKKVIDIDGARVVFDDGWGLVRTSSNMPVLVLVFEAKTPQRLKEIENIFRQELSNFSEIGKDWHNG